MSDDNQDLQAYLESLPDKLTAELADVIREQAEALSDAQRAALQALEQSPEETGDLEVSCVVVPGSSPLEYAVQAGGDLTTKEVREGSGVDYDYALAFEFGTSRQSARPFFWSTYQARKDEIQQAIDEAANEVIK
ncbi:HK97-gp10 family putative phage morphogenesis protein [Nitrobacter sp.]|uniref:HK97-gp10 family putative phage morphogenesis protein n=1 Tax=Nitrobacter sp. TaxID=29420 RepID=UPI003F65491A